MNYLYIFIGFIVIFSSALYLFVVNTKKSLQDCYFGMSDMVDFNDAVEIHPNFKPPKPVVLATGVAVAVADAEKSTLETTKEVDLVSIKKEIESKCNFANALEGLKASPDEIKTRLQTGFDMLEERTGRKGMTYSEMRELFG